MKALKIVLGVIAAVVLIILVAAIFVPNENHVQRSVVINAPIEAVRANVMSFEAMLKWSPWHERDPNQEYSIEKDGAVGALYHWSGEDSLVGEGKQTITEMSDNKVVTHLSFIRPWEGEADATTTLEEVEEGVKVTWSYDDHMPYPMNIFNVVMDMDAMLGPDFEAGVNKLKEITEKEAKEKTTFNGLNIQVVDLDPRTYVGVRDTIGWDEMESFFMTNFPLVAGKVSKAVMEMTGMPSALYYMWDEENKRTDLLAGVPVAGGTVDGFESEEVGGKALLVEYYGPYEGTGDAHEALDAYMKWHDVEFGKVAIEEYVTDPGLEPDTSKWLTKVMYPIQ